MNMTRHACGLLAALAAFGPLISCKSTTFSGQTTQAGANSSSGNGGGSGGSAGGNGSGGNGTNNTDSNTNGANAGGGGANTGPGGTGGSSANGGPGGGLGTTSGGANDATIAGGSTVVPPCKPNTAPNNYNIMFIFDKTGSQLKTDPTLVRRSGALQFLGQLDSYVAAAPTATVYVGVLAFNTTSIRAAKGWLLLNSTNQPTIQQEIITATSNPEGDTSYSPVLDDAATFFGQINSQANAATARNYVVFLTDGLPNTDTQYAITAAVNNLVNNYGVAIIAVATGPDVPPEGEAMVKALAQPTKPSKFPDHVGRYYRAATASALTNVWGTLFAQIGGCGTH